MTSLIECSHQRAVTRRVWHAVAPCLVWGWVVGGGCPQALRGPYQRPGGAVCALRILADNDCVGSGWSQRAEQWRMAKSVWPALAPELSREREEGGPHHHRYWSFAGGVFALPIATDDV